MWCWGRLLRVPWTARRFNQFILKEFSPECSLERLMLKLKLQYLATWYEQLTHLKRPWCWERSHVGGEGDDRGWDGWMASLTQWMWVWVNSGSWWDREAWHAAAHGVTKSRTERLNWTERYLSIRTFLADQWLRLWAFTAGGRGSTPGQGTKILNTEWPKKKKKIFKYLW